MKTEARNSRQRGFTLLEYAIAAALTAGAMAVLVRQTTDQQVGIKNRAAAQQMQQVLDAENLYVKSNFSALSTAATAGAPVVVNVTGPAVGAFQSVQTAGFLPSTFVGDTPYNQKMIMLVRQPVAGRLEVITTTTGGEAIPDGSLGDIAGLIGAPGGFMATNAVGGSSGKVTGSYGGWVADASTWTNGTNAPTAGHYMSTLTYSTTAITSSSGAYLSRVATGDPVDNQMSTAIDMNSNDLNNAGNIVAATVSATTSMQAPVYYDSDNTFYFLDPSNVSRVHVLAADGNMQAPRFYDLDNTAYYLDPASTSQINSLNANGNVNVAGNVNVTGNVAANMLYPTSTATAGAACAPNGLLSKDSTGASLACVSGVWTKPGFAIGTPIGNVTAGYQTYFTAPSDGALIVKRGTCGTIVNTPGTSTAFYGLNPVGQDYLPPVMFLLKGMTTNFTDAAKCKTAFVPLG